MTMTAAPMIDVWITCPDRDSARRIGRTLVERRLAACANIFGEIESIYHWQGSIEEAREVPLLLKTRQDLFAPLAAAARALHPYDVPAIHAVAAADVTPDYRDWLAAETARPD
jgi:periplasmic divalent cation tolerance protein